MFEILLQESDDYLQNVHAAFKVLNLNNTNLAYILQIITGSCFPKDSIQSLRKASIFVYDNVDEDDYLSCSPDDEEIKFQIEPLDSQDLSSEVNQYFQTSRNN